MSQEVNTNNIGQVTGLFIGSHEPANKNLIWYDNTSNQMCHKVYDYKTKSWVALNPVIVAPTTYSEIVNNAKKNGLPVGKHYQITDKSNVLAVSITKTKICYTDTLGNILIDDLGTNIQYHASSSNILIDDVNGAFDTKRNKLIFSFVQTIPDFDNDFVLGKKKFGANWVLSKFKLPFFLSKSSDNAISWNEGFFFNFKSAINNLLNKVGGIVGYDKYSEEIKELNATIGNVSKENQEIIKNANDLINNETTSNKIYDKKIPKSIDISINPTDANKGDTLFNILSKFQRWINKFKYADGIFISKNFADAESEQYVNNNDTVNSAFSKVQYLIKNSTTVGTLPSNWTTNATDNGSGQTDGAYGRDGFPVPGDTLSYTFSKIVDCIKGGGKYLKLSEDWKEITYTGNVNFPKAGNTIDTAVSLLTAKFRQLGEISNGKLLDGATSGQHTNFNLTNGSLSLNNDKLIMDFNGVRYNNPYGVSDTGFYLSVDKFEFGTNYASISENGVWSAAVIKTSSTNGNSCAFQSVSSGTGSNIFDAFFSRLKVGSLTFNKVFITSTSYAITRQASLIIVNSSEEATLYLPNNPEDGLMILIFQASATAFNVRAQGTDKIDTINESTESVRISQRGAMYAFIYVSNVSYSSSSSSGLWECCRWNNQF